MTTATTTKTRRRRRTTTTFITLACSLPPFGNPLGELLRGHDARLSHNNVTARFLLQKKILDSVHCVPCVSVAGVPMAVAAVHLRRAKATAPRPRQGSPLLALPLLARLPQTGWCKGYHLRPSSAALLRAFLSALFLARRRGAPVDRLPRHRVVACAAALRLPVAHQ